MFSLSDYSLIVALQWLNSYLLVRPHYNSSSRKQDTWLGRCYTSDVEKHMYSLSLQIVTIFTVRNSGFWK